jgi:hypothetical protein
MKGALLDMMVIAQSGPLDRVAQRIQDTVVGFAAPLVMALLICALLMAAGKRSASAIFMVLAVFFVIAMPIFNVDGFGQLVERVSNFLLT